MSHRSFARLLARATLLSLVLAVWVPATAAAVQSSLSPRVGRFDFGAFGLSSLPTLSPTGIPRHPRAPSALAQSSVALVGGGQPDPSKLPASLLRFDVTIGDTNWQTDASMSPLDVHVLVQGVVRSGSRHDPDTRPEGLLRH